jgi:hypothetical protein
MLLANPYSFLSEAATQDLMDPATSKEVKDTVDDLEDTLTNNVEEIKPDDMVTNGGVPVTTEESAVLIEAAGGYFLAMEAVISICEDKAAEDLPADETPTPDAVADQADGVVEQIANANGVDKDDITIVINADEAAYICECAINESKASKGKKKGGKSIRKAKVLAKVSKALEGKVKLFKKGKKKK